MPPDVDTFPLHFLVVIRGGGLMPGLVAWRLCASNYAKINTTMAVYKPDLNGDILRLQNLAP
jgi:hypothetical protein